jgi:hypothetical protein
VLVVVFVGAAAAVAHHVRRRPLLRYGGGCRIPAGTVVRVGAERGSDTYARSERCALGVAILRGAARHARAASWCAARGNFERW